ncbi:MAG: hypothetical protein RR014_03325 [Bilophila sp.]
MKAIVKTMAVAGALLLLGGCATQQQTPQEEAFQAAQNQCTTQTNSMVNGSRNAWGGGLEWSNYFEWCMGNQGYTKEQLKTIWY